MKEGQSGIFLLSLLPVWALRLVTDERPAAKCETPPFQSDAALFSASRGKDSVQFSHHPTGAAYKIIGPEMNYLSVLVSSIPAQSFEGMSHTSQRAPCVGQKNKLQAAKIHRTDRACGIVTSARQRPLICNNVGCLMQQPGGVTDFYCWGEIKAPRLLLLQLNLFVALWLNYSFENDAYSDRKGVGVTVKCPRTSIKRCKGVSFCLLTGTNHWHIVSMTFIPHLIVVKHSARTGLFDAVQIKSLNFPPSMWWHCIKNNLWLDTHTHARARTHARAHIHTHTSLDYWLMWKILIHMQLSLVPEFVFSQTTHLILSYLPAHIHWM